MAGVRIPVYEQQTSAQQGTGAQANARGLPVGDIGAGLQRVGGALENAGQDINRVDILQGKILKQQAEENGKSYANKAASTGQLQWLKTLQDRQDQAEGPAAGFTPALLGDYDTWAKQTLDQAPTPESKKYLDQHFVALRNELGARALDFEHKATLNYRADQFTEATTNWAKVVEQDPSKFPAAKQALMETLPEVGPEGRTKLSDYLDKALRLGATQGAIQRDAAGVKAIIDRALNPSAATPSPAAVVGGTVNPPKPIPAAVEQYADTIDKAAADTGVDPGFLRSQLAVESGGNAGAANTSDIRVTGKPSLGIAQFQPDTAARYGINNPLDPQQAIPGQARYMADLLKMFGGDYAKAAAGYNWGEGNVQKSVAKWGDAWRDHIPATTRDYLDKIGVQQPGPAQAVEPQVLATGEAYKTGVPYIDALSVDELLHFQNEAASSISKAKTEARAGLEATVKDHESQALTGPQPQQPLTADQFTSVYGEADGASRYKQYAANLNYGANVQQLGKMDPTQTQALLAANKPAADQPGYAAQEARYENLSKAAAAVDQQRQADPIAFAAQQQLYPIKPLNPQDPAGMAAELASRAGIAKDMAQRYGTTPAVMSKSESAALSGYLGQVPGAQRVQMLETLRSGLRDNGLYTSVLNDLRKDSPVTAMVGNIAAVGGQVTVGEGKVPAAEVARRIAVGEDLLNKTKDAKGTDGNRGGFQMPKEADLRQAWVDATGKAYAGFPDAETTAYEAFRAYYAERSASKGVYDPKAAVDVDIQKEAIDAATGGLSDWGAGWFKDGALYHSSTKVVRPYGMSDADFKDKAAATWATIGPANGYAKTQVSDLGLVPTGVNGQYKLTAGTSQLLGKDGQPLVMTLTGAR